MTDQFYNFDEALDQLNLKEEELKRLVSEGEIRAFRDGETMKLRVADVENLRNELMGGEVVDLGGAGEELVFEDDLELEEAGMATEEISDMDTLLEEDVEDVGEVELEEEEGEDDEVEAPAVRRTTSAAAAAVAGDEEKENVVWMSLAILTSFVLILALPIVISLAKGDRGALASGVAGIFAEFPAE